MCSPNRFGGSNSAFNLAPLMSIVPQWICSLEAMGAGSSPEGGDRRRAASQHPAPALSNQLTGLLRRYGLTGIPRIFDSVLPTDEADRRAYEPDTVPRTSTVYSMTEVAEEIPRTFSRCRPRAAKTNRTSGLILLVPGVYSLCSRRFRGSGSVRQPHHSRFACGGMLRFRLQTEL